MRANPPTLLSLLLALGGETGGTVIGAVSLCIADADVSGLPPSSSVPFYPALFLFLRPHACFECGSVAGRYLFSGITSCFLERCSKDSHILKWSYVVLSFITQV